MKQFLVTVAGGLAVGLILNRLRQPMPAGTQASDYSGSAYQQWAAQQGQG